MDVDLLHLSCLLFFLLLLMQHLFTNFVLILAGELGKLAQKVFIASAVVTGFFIAPRWGLSTLIFATFACFCLWGATLACLSTLPVVGLWLAYLHEGHPIFSACRHALPGTWFHKLVRELCGFGIWLGESVDLLGQPGVCNTLLERSIDHVIYPQEVEWGMPMFDSLIQIFFEIVTCKQEICEMILLHHYLCGRLHFSRDRPVCFLHSYTSF